MSIFVSIAAYRDAELGPTIAHALARARWPNDLCFGVCWQHDDDELAPPELEFARTRVIDVPWRESRGACWARAAIMDLYDGEDWFLQLDSHHRFAQDWDAKLIAQAEASASARPLISTYVTPYDPGAPLIEPAAPTRMHFDRFTPQGIPTFRFTELPLSDRGSVPVRARFVSAHMLFAPGRFVEDVPYDPDLYFIGEEITLAVRAFTHGYDMYHPTEHIAWHEYTRDYRPKHWDDHVAGKPVAMPWHDRDASSLARVQHLLADRPLGRFGFGTARSVSDYEDYAGIDFRRRTASEAARRGDTPGSPRTAAEDRHWAVRFAIGRAALPVAACEDPMFWYVGFHDANDVEIARLDADRAEMRGAVGPDGAIRLERHFASAQAPMRWTLWPTDRHGRWLDPMVGPIDPDAAASGVIEVTA